MKGFAPLLLLPFMPWIVGLLGAGVIAAWFQGFAINVITVILLMIVGLFLLAKLPEVSAMSDNALMPVIILVLALGSILASLYIVNPGLFAGLNNLSVAGSSYTGVVTEAKSNSLLEIVPWAQSGFASMTPLLRAIAVIAVLSTMYLGVTELKK